MAKSNNLLAFILEHIKVAPKTLNPNSDAKQSDLKHTATDPWDRDACALEWAGLR